MGHVLRLKDTPTKHIFYEHEEDGRLQTEQLKYAEEFDSENDANEFKNKFENGDDFEAVPIYQAYRENKPRPKAVENAQNK